MGRFGSARVLVVLRSVFFFLLLLLPAFACGKREEAKAEPAPPKVAEPPPAQTGAGPIGVLAPRDQVRILAAPVEGEVAAIVKSARSREESDGRTLLVYVGATWCEPCQRFHQAAAHGDLDKAFPTLTLLEFDADRDGERLLNAGYSSRFIPYFAVPAPDGRATDRHMEGSVKGEGAVSEIAPRLRALLQK